MGIQGLLRNLHPLLVPPPTHHSNQQSKKSNTTSIKIQHNIRQFANKSLAIDASSWLHKAGYTCSARLVESIESKTRDPQAEKSYSDYMIRRCEGLLRDAKISTIYLVFDGVRVPLKRGTNADREAKRQANLKEARRLISIGRRKEAEEKYKLCVKGTEMMARVVCAAVQRKWGKSGPVKCVFAPYEADSQLAKLCVDGLAHAVVTEDSDVLVYSAVSRRPFPIIYKLDKKNGSCDVVTMDWLLNSKFLTSSGVNGGRRRRRDLESDSDDDSSDEEDEATMHVGEKKVNVASSSMNDVEEHPSEIDYGDDNNMMFAPIRRALPLPSSNGNGRGRSKGTGSELLSFLRAFASREVTNPGAGVRLFVQACVLSGCDYVANNMSKVGPIGAFKMVKENAHRDPTIRFERILRGAKISVDATEKASNDLDDDVHGDDIFDSLLPSASDDQRKEKYEELLSQSEAVFYYHLVKDVDADEIVPLVAHKLNDDRCTILLEVGEKFKPSLKRFESGVASFVGSAEEALKKINKPAPPIQQSNGGWMTTSKGRAFINNNKTSNSNLRQAKPAATAQPAQKKKTSLDKFLASAGNKKPSSKSTGLNLVRTSSKMNNWSTSKQTQSIRSMPKKNPYEKSATAVNRSVQKDDISNPFGRFAHNDDTKSIPKKTPINNRSKGSNKNTMSSFLSPHGAGINFDYGVLSASKPRTEKKPSREKSPERTKSKEECDSIEPAPIEMNENRFESTLPEPQKTEASMVVKHSLYDYEYEIVTESPPRSSKYFSKTKVDPRRVSSSPTEHFKSDRTSSTEIIDLVDDSNEENILNERKPNTPLRIPPMKSSVNRKRRASALLAGFEKQKETCEPRKKSSIGGSYLFGQDKKAATTKSSSVATIASVKRPTKKTSLKQFFGGKS